MKKNAIVLLHDYWHHGDTIKPLLPLIFDEKEWFVKVTDDPNYIGSLFVAPDLIINFKDGVANTIISLSATVPRSSAMPRAAGSSTPCSLGLYPVARISSACSFL